MKRKQLVKTQKIKPVINSNHGMEKIISSANNVWTYLTNLRKKGNELYLKEKELRRLLFENSESIKTNRIEVEKILTKMTGIKLEELGTI